MEKVTEFNCTTGETIVRDLTDEELAQREIDKAKFAQLKVERELAESQLQAKKAAAEAKLAVLGLTSDDLKALGLA